MFRFVGDFSFFIFNIKRTSANFSVLFILCILSHNANADDSDHGVYTVGTVIVKPLVHDRGDP